MIPAAGQLPLSFRLPASERSGFGKTLLRRSFARFAALRLCGFAALRENRFRVDRFG
jgi:hypothetical protein